MPKRKDGTDGERRPYGKPQVQRVELVPEEAVLAYCKGYDFLGPGDLEKCGLPLGACLLEADS